MPLLLLAYWSFDAFPKSHLCSFQPNIPFFLLGKNTKKKNLAFHFFSSFQETTLYVTLEPCPMCAGAILQARIDTLVWGAPNKLLGADGSWIRLFPNGGEGGSGSELTDKTQAPAHPFHPKMTIRRGVLASECSDAMQQFFQLRRKQKEKKPDMPAPPSCLPISNHPSKFMTKMHGIFHMFCL